MPAASPIVLRMSRRFAWLKRERIDHGVQVGQRRRSGAGARRLAASAGRRPPRGLHRVADPPLHLGDLPGDLAVRRIVFARAAVLAQRVVQLSARLERCAPDRDARPTR